MLSGDTEMTLRCTSHQVIDAESVHLSLEIAPYDVDDVEYEPDSPFGCALSEEAHDVHGAFLRYVPGSLNEVWFFWDSGRERGCVVVLSPCNKPNPDQACTLYRGHPGKCDWDFIDPVRVAMMARLDQRGALFRESEGVSGLAGLSEILRTLRPDA
jgi:hypothetical protein